MPADDQDCLMKGSALTDTWALSLPNRFALLLVSSLVLHTLAPWINSLPGFFLFILCHLYLFHYIIICRGGISLVHLSTTPVTSDTISVTIRYIRIIRFCYMLHCAQLNTLVASKAGNEPVPRAACGNSSISHTHLTGICPNLISKMLGKLFSHRTDTHQLLTPSESIQD